jgi:biotin carboxyl carrier protein
MKYFVTIEDHEFEIEVDGDRIVVDGVESKAHLGTVAGTPLRHLLIDDRSRTVAVEAGARGHWQVAYHGDRWEAEAVDERTRHIRTLTAGASAPRGPGAIRAPMPGLVVRLEVEVGQRVPSGYGVVVLEAMKMENELRAPTAGIVKSVRVKQGQPVEKGEVLVEFEDE